MVRTAVGYAGGQAESPNYQNINDHSEVVRVEYDPKVISYIDLLKVFWEAHDPTLESFLRQYRTAIFHLDETQRLAAERSLKETQSRFNKPVATVIEPAGPFYLAEDYHQKYLLRQAADLFEEMQTIYPDSHDLVASTAAARINGYLGCNGEREVLQQEIGRLGLSPQMQQHLVDHLSNYCHRFKGMTCPAPKG